jgi:hypothetical protein
MVMSCVFTKTGKYTNASSVSVVKKSFGVSWDTILKSSGLQLEFLGFGLQSVRLYVPTDFYSFTALDFVG